MTVNALPSVSALDAEHLARHRWYFFKEAFSPAIVEHAIKDAELPTGSLVFDPFSGSGTTPLQAGLAGLRGAGMEVNPFLRFVAKTKSTSATLDSFDTALALAIDGAGEGAESPLAAFSTFSELAPMAQKREKWLFNSSVLSAFEGGHLQVTDRSGPEFDLVRLCLIGAAMDTANATKDGKCLRYKKDWSDLRLNDENFIHALIHRGKIVREDLEATADCVINAEITLGDSRTNPSATNFDLCVTSPPYLNSFDYTDVYRPELFLGRFIDSMPKLRALRLATLRSHVQVAWDVPMREDFGLRYVEAMAELREAEGARSPEDRRLWSGRLPLMIQAYFEDMGQVLSGLRKRANPSASVWLVVSTSAYAGVEFPVDLIIADIAGRCGWYLREVTVLRYLKRVAGQQWNELSQREGVDGPHLRESLVVLDAKRRRVRS